MYRCLELAKKGIGYVAPNPMVGAVILHEGKIIGEGFHRRYGGSHAEVHAIRSVKNQALLKQSTLYVNLEPCSHYGKTPPCSELILEKQIPRVVIGQEDPFSKVSGKGIKMLQDAGLEVIVGILKKECEELNKRFVTFVTKKRPYIILKWAQSSDGFIDKVRELNDGQTSVRFSDDFTKILVHKMRAEESAIMVGSRTEKLDRPLLNVRYWFGNDPVKIKADSTQSLPELMSELYKKGIQSLIVEGGTMLLQSFIDQNLWDEARMEVSLIQLNQGVKAPLVSGRLENVQICEKTSILIYKP